MPKRSEKKLLPYTSDQLFDLVADVGRYPEFLPWCIGARIYNRRPERFDADVIIGFKMFRERFTSRVTLSPHKSVDVDYISGPMKRLYNHWRFMDHEMGCIVDFEVDFEFDNPVLEKMIGRMFAEATDRMIDAFVERSHTLYGV